MEGHDTMTTMKITAPNGSGLALRQRLGLRGRQQWDIVGFSATGNEQLVEAGYYSHDGAALVMLQAARELGMIEGGSRG
jgi:hypothetical protein